MADGKLYDCDGKLLAEVDYKCFSESKNWWGELTLEEFRRLRDGDGYILMLEDGRYGHCFLKKKVNRAVHGLTPLYCYTFKGNGELQLPA